MNTHRKPAVAGLFYPEGEAELVSAVQDYLDQAAPSGEAPKALIAPHAGYRYSGPIAGSAYALLAPLRARIQRVVLIGPSHQVAFHGIALSGAAAFDTPLGPIPVDAAGNERALSCPGVRVFDEAHAQEHGLEVQLPFLQQTLDHFAIVPLVVGEATGREVAAVLEALWGGEETLLVISSDLSHYLDYDRARALDTRTSAAIEALQPDDITPAQACGRLAIQGLLHGALAHGLQAETLDQRSSGDTAGSRDRVVGYGAYVFR